MPEALLCLLLYYSNRLSSWGCDGNAADDGLSSLYFREGDAEAPVLGAGGDHSLYGTAVAGLCPGVKVVDNEAVVDGNVEYAETFVVGGLTDIAAVPRLGEVKFDAVEGGVCGIADCGDGQVVPETVAAEAEELE